ncbi:MAG: lytic transglycosylase domain-containing protein [Nitrospirae bacterium]|nr:lytic transglycosylase domain-containing protein [Nitrospirota bacterium]
MTKAIFIMVLAICMAGGISAYADIYKYVDEEGITHFTNTAPASDVNYKKVISTGRKKQSNRAAATPADYHRIIADKSQKYNVEPSLVNAVIKVESNFDSTAISRKGAMGLMQLMPYTAEDMDVRNPLDPEENIDGGTRYIKYLLDKFGGNLTLALAAYNAGPDTVKKFGYVPPIQETRQYVNKVLSLYNGKNSVPSSPTVAGKPQIVYKVIYEDGTVLYTNTPFAYPNFSRF